MAYKDEYEVARLYTDGGFAAQLERAFEGELRLELVLAPPFLAKKDARGAPRKTSFGPWIFPVLRLLARLKVLRGGPFDIFGRAEERRRERALIGEYEALLDEIGGRLNGANHALALALASTPEKIRGYGHVKMRSLEAVWAEQTALLRRLRADAASERVAAE